MSPPLNAAYGCGKQRCPPKLHAVNSPCATALYPPIVSNLCISLKRRLARTVNNIADGNNCNPISPRPSCASLPSAVKKLKLYGGAFLALRAPKSAVADFIRRPVQPRPILNVFAHSDTAALASKGAVGPPFSQPPWRDLAVLQRHHPPSVSPLTRALFVRIQLGRQYAAFVAAKRPWALSDYLFLGMLTIILVRGSIIPFLRLYDHRYRQYLGINIPQFSY